MSSVFEQLGGQSAVDAAVDIFYRRVLADELVSHFFASVDMERQRLMQSVFLTMAFGGPSHYTGKGLRSAHRHLALTDAHFDAIAGHLQGTLEELNVAPPLLDAVMAIAESTRADVLGR